MTATLASLFSLTVEVAMRRRAKHSVKRFNRRHSKTHKLNKSAPFRGGIRL